MKKGRKRADLPKRLRQDIYRRLFLRMILYSILFWGIFWLLGFFRWGSLFWIYSLFWSAMSALVFHLVVPLVGVWILYFAGIFLFLFFALRRQLLHMGALCSGVGVLADQSAPLPTFPDEMRELSLQLEQARQAILQSRWQAAEAEQRKNDLVVYLAHDLKTPLTSVIGSLSLLEEAPDMPLAQRAKYTGIALKKAYRLEDLVNEFFEITRFNLSSVQLERGRLNLSRMLLQMADEFFPALLERGLRCETQIEPDILVTADADKLARVFENLLRNAAAYAYPDTAIRIKAKRRPA